MSGFLVRLLITALGLWAAQAIVPGVEIRDVGTLFLAALLLGIVNAGWAIRRLNGSSAGFPSSLVAAAVFGLSEKGSQ